VVTVISLKGIDEAISSLNYRDNKTLKYRLVHAIRESYESKGSVSTLQGIDTDELVKTLWDTGDDPSTIKSKRKNLSSIKSSVNADLKRLYEDEKNPEGIIIGRSNVFIMSDEAKDRLLTSFTSSAKGERTVTLEKINEVLNIIHEVLSDPEAIANQELSDGSDKLSRLKDIIQGLSQKLEFSGTPLGKEGFSDEIDRPPGHPKEEENVIAGSETPHLSLQVTTESRNDLDDSAQSQKDEIPCYGGKDKASVSVTPGPGGGAYEPGRGQGITPEGALAAVISADTGGSEESTEEELEIVGQAELLEEADTEEVELDEPEEVEDDAEIVDEADLPEEAAPDEAEPIEEIEESEVEESLQEVEIVNDRAEAEAEEADLEEGLAEVGTGGDLEEAEPAEDLEEITSESSEKITAGEAAVVDEAGGIEEIKPGEAKNAEAPVEEEAEIVEEAELVEDAAPEEVEPGELEDAQDIEEITEDEVEELEISGNDAEPGLSAGGSEAGYSDSVFGEDNKILRARLLAEEFNCLLGAREKFYNQHILIPAGEYIVGNKSPGKDERLEQKVRLTSFYMGKFPVTNALFEVFVEKTGYKTIAEKLGYGKVYYGRFKKTVDEKTGLVKLICQSGLSCQTVYGACWHKPSGPGSTIHNKRNHPVVQVSLEDAMAFAAWTGKRLPTEDEWEAAARTADGYVLPWGNDWQRDACNIEDRSIADTTPVDRYMDFANNFGIVDALGNVLEWTMEHGEPPSYAKHDVKYYVAKGGGWISGNDIRLFNRFKLEAKMHSNTLGFRCVAY